MTFPHRPRGLRALATTLALLAAPGGLSIAQTVAPAPPTAPAAETIPEALLQLRHFRQLGSVLYSAAHPDDENTTLLSWLSRGQGYRTADLSLTRGDGGQNVIGPELGDKLGVARTQELLAGRRLDGAQQYFSRALDFGFSKDYADTQRIWGREEVIGDIVRVIRRFRPDVILTRFSTQPGGTHGHHTASAILTLEAFKLAGDPRAYPEQIAQGLQPWQPKRILQNANLGRGAPSSADVLQIETAGDDPVLGIPLSTLSLRVLSQHKTQNLGDAIQGVGRGAMRWPRTEVFIHLDGERATTGLFDSVATTWTARYPGPGAEIDALAEQAVANFNSADLTANIPALLLLRAKLAALPTDPLVTDKRAQLDRALRACLGLDISTTAAASDAVPGEMLALTHHVTSAVPLRWTAIRTATGENLLATPVDLAAHRAVSHRSTPTLPTDTPLTTPYWLRAEGHPGLARIDDPALIGDAENSPTFPLTFVFEIGGQTLTVADEPLAAVEDPRPHRLGVVPPVSLAFTDGVTIFKPGATRTVTVEIAANRPVRAGSLALELPSGWRTQPAARDFALNAPGTKARVEFTVTAPATPSAESLGAVATIDGRTYRTAREEINYPHLPPQLIQPVARQRIVALDVAVAARKVGYLPGAGDEIPAALAQLGCDVVPLTGADLTPATLGQLDAVVLGVRAINVRDDLAATLPALFAWVEAGGTVVAQYNRPGRDLAGKRVAPYDFSIGGNEARVTDEDAAMTLLAPAHAAFNTPNKLTDADWAGWVQERGAYFATSWAPEFTPLLACADAGEQPQQGALLVARHGKGYYVYTGLGFFRQLPAGVPGAYRLFANLISLGK